MADFLCQNEGTVYEAVAYYRLSKYAKSNDSESIANQRKLVREYLSRHPEILLVDEQEDDGFTGTNMSGPVFRQLCGRSGKRGQTASLSKTFPVWDASISKRASIWSGYSRRWA